jgi:uncharacterized protein (TIGR00369 family)
MGGAKIAGLLSPCMFTTDHVALANGYRRGTLAEVLGMEFSVDAEGCFQARMPVDERTFQPMRQLHGGATAALAETLGSMGSALLIDRVKQAVVGIELNANHLRAVRTGNVIATGRLIHKGRTTHVWDISVANDKGELVAVCRITNLIIDQRS